MNLLIHATKEGKFLNHANAVEKKKKKQKSLENMESDTSQRLHHKRSHRTK